MSSKDIIRAGESGGRRAAIREVVPKPSQEKLPSHMPLPKPTRDISASNRSQSIILQEQPLPYSDRRILDREAEEFEYERQANIVYTRQFKTLGKMLGNESMDFDQIKVKVQDLMAKESNSQSQVDLKYRIQFLEKELVRKEGQRSSQYIGNSEYIKTMEAEISRKSKLISQLSDSVKKEDFEEVYKELQMEVSSRDKQLRTLEAQMQEARAKSASQIGTLEEELIKRNQSIQKLHFELDSLKRKIQVLVEDNDRAKKREKDLQLSLQTETKGTYQGVSYSISSLVLQLQSKDQNLREGLQQLKMQQQQIQHLTHLNQQFSKDLQIQETTAHELRANLQYQKSIAARQGKQIEQLNQQIMNQDTAIDAFSQENTEHRNKITQLQMNEMLLKDKCQQLESELQLQGQQNTEMKRKIIEYETTIVQLKSSIEDQKYNCRLTKNDLEVHQQRHIETMETLAQKQMQLQNLQGKYQLLVQSVQLKEEEQQQANKALEFQLNEATDALNSKQMELERVQIKIVDYEERQKASALIKQRSSDEHEQLKKQIKQLTEEISNKDKQHQQLIKTLNEKEENAHRLTLEIQHLNTAYTVLKGDAAISVQEIQQEMEKTRKTILDQSQQISLLKTEISNKNTDIQKYNQGIEEIRLQKEEAVTENAQFRRTIQDLQGKVSAFETQLTEKNIQIENINQSHCLTQQQLTDLTSKLQRIKSSNVELTTNIASLQQEINIKNIKIEQILQSISQKQEKSALQIDTLQKNISSFEQKLRKEIQSKSVEIEGHRQQIQRNEEYSLAIKTLEQEIKVKRNAEIEAHQLKTKLEEYQNIKKQLEEDHNHIKAAFEAKQEQNQKYRIETSTLKSQIEQLVVELEHKVKITQEKVETIRSLEQQLQKGSAVEESTKLIRSQRQQQELLSQSMVSEYGLKIKLLQEQVSQGEILRQQIQSLRVKLEESQHQTQNISEDYYRSRQQNHLQSEQIMSLKEELEKKEHEIRQLSLQFQRTAAIEQKICDYELLLSEAKVELEQKESNFLAKHSSDQIEIDELKKQLQIERERIQDQRIQMSQKLQILHEQLEREKRRCDEEVQSRTTLEQEQIEIHKIHQEINISSQNIETELYNFKSENIYLQTKVRQLQMEIKDKTDRWLNEKKQLTIQIDQLNANIRKRQDQFSHQMQNVNDRHQEEHTALKIRFNQIEQLLQNLQQERKEQIIGQEREEPRGPTLGNEIQNCTFNYYEGQEDDVNSDSPVKENERYHRIQQRQNQLQQLRALPKGTSTDLTYSKSQEEDSLKIMLISLTEERNKAQIQVLRLKGQDLARVQAQNFALQRSEATLQGQIKGFLRQLQEKENIINQLRRSEGSSQLLTLKHKYEETLNNLQENNRQLERQINKFKEQIELLRKDNELHKQVSIGREQDRETIRKLLEEIGALEKKEIQNNQEMNEIKDLMGEISAMKEQIEAAQKESQKIQKARKDLQIRNDQLLTWNNALNNLLKTQREGQEHRILSKLSKKSNVSGRGESQQGGGSVEEEPSSDGELSRKILNYDPSKISGQESKFSPLLVFQNSKIHVIREPAASPEHERTEIKEQRNQQSVLSKTLQERERSIESSHRQMQEHRSQASRRQTPKLILPSEHDIAQHHAQTNSINQNQQRASNTHSSRKNSIHSSRTSKQEAQDRSLHHQLTDQLESNISKDPERGGEAEIKQEYLPQNSSKKTIQSNSQKKAVVQEPTQEIVRQDSKHESFQKKIHIGTIPPIYVARPTIIDNLSNIRRDSSGSRSNSRSKITISYGKPADRSIEMKGSPIHRVPGEDRSELSKKSSRITEMRALIDPPNEFSPISIKRPDVHQTPSQSLQTSVLNQAHSQSKILRESFVKKVQKVQSESIINNVANVKFSTVGNSSPIAPQTVKQESSPEPLESRINTIVGPKLTNLVFRPVQSARYSVTSPINFPPQPVQSQTSDLEKRSQMMRQQKKSEGVPSTPMKINMKRVSSGRRMNSGMGDTLTFGNRSRKDNESMGSSSSDSGIEVMQYDWTAPCCKGSQ